MKNNYKYLHIISSIYALLLLFRIIETTLVFYKYSFGLDTLRFEATGLLYDILGASIFIIGYSIIYFLLSKIKPFIAKAVSIMILVLASLLFFINTAYFLYQLTPLDIFVYKYSFEEISFTVKTSNTNFVTASIFLLLLLALVTALVWRIHKIHFSKRTSRLIYAMVLLSLPIYFAVTPITSQKPNYFILNKSFYFTSTSLQYGLQAKDSIQNTNKAFQQLYPNKNFISQDYPLMYKIERKNVLKPYFKTFDSPPNIVILIIEGLNNDFIHEYKGALLMPFLHALKDKSLYWNKCFTLGERSYAVVPSLLGGLPYGDMGFTLQDQLPRHVSLVSVLNTNHYYTSFYYGQGAWFHQKDRFFKHNDMNLIFDNSKFCDDYKKIIVGNDHFFWGYTDKALFKQSLRIIDTIKAHPRLDIYFTGTTHSPFFINQESYYSKKLNQLTPKGYASFYHTNAKYLKTLLFSDDALRDFFEAYKQRPDYKNTIFIITGDHPMTELPIANALKRYHVPLLIFSEKLKDAHTFSNIASHLDISETLLSFLADYIEHTPQISTSLGSPLVNNTKTPKNIAFMNGNRDVIDFLYGNFYLSANVLYEVDDSLNISISENEDMKSILTKKVNTFANTSLYVARKNKLVSPQAYCKMLNHTPAFVYQNTDSVIHNAHEFFNIAHKIPIANTTQIFDVSFNISAANNKNFKMVYEINNTQDSILLWESLSITEKELVQDHISFSPFHNKDSILYFSAYIWNKNQLPFEISDIEALLHTPKTK